MFFSSGRSDWSDSFGQLKKGLDARIIRFLFHVLFSWVLDFSRHLDTAGLRCTAVSGWCRRCLFIILRYSSGEILILRTVGCGAERNPFVNHTVRCGRGRAFVS